MATPYRNRFDEIVEEELNGKRLEIPAVLGYVKRIAERAFRHGVEQGLGPAPGVLKYIQSVRPAPAKGGCACGCDDPWAHQGQGNVYPVKQVAWGSVPGGWIDRRKDQRRHPQACPTCGKEFQYQWIRSPDRRSGKDRRKP